ncbi:glutamine-rich protein 2-like isoform X2 [Gigantopelta aegis]|uniref:glutamine-rich protein 2-like isoform X2 n=1 Tax=Gigantopelta aegis TaxID=1735272 RepID=UPI001B88B18B|nr:glutamine-rich protein 2-like isoform X2 [Gigantopelta aegis]
MQDVETPRGQPQHVGLHFLEFGSMLDDQFAYTKNKLLELDDKVKKLTHAMTGGSAIEPSKMAGSSVSAVAVRRMQQAIQQLQEQTEGLQDNIKDLTEENTKKNQELQNLLEYCDAWNRADADYMAMEIDVKAYKRQLQDKVNKNLFDATTSEINRMIKEILDKLSENDDTYKVLVHDLEGKLDRMEIPQLKKWLESRLKSLNKKLQQGAGEIVEDAAAGLRKQLLLNFNCLSCDRALSVAPTAPVPSIPNQQGLSPRKTIRPYVTYEMDQVRMNTKSLRRNVQNLERALAEKEIAKLRSQLYDMQTLKRHYQKEPTVKVEEMLDTYATVRPCGGPHTLMYLRPLSNNSQVAYRQAEDSDVGVQGVDGHIYKGSSDHVPPDAKLPTSTTPLHFRKHMSPQPPSVPKGSSSRTEGRALTVKSVSPTNDIAK